MRKIPLELTGRLLFSGSCCLMALNVLLVCAALTVQPRHLKLLIIFIFMAVQSSALIIVRRKIVPLIKSYNLLIHSLKSQLPPDQAEQMTSAEGLLSAYTERLFKSFEQKLNQKQTSLTTLQSQINPHFLYNTLDSIRGQALEYRVPEIADMTEALSSFFRYNVSKGANMVPLREELRNIQTYFCIQQYRFENRFSLHVENPDIQALDCYLPKLTLQPLVENCIFHGLEKKTGPGLISIRIALTEKRLLLTITDNGVGISGEKLLTIQESLRRGEPTKSLSSGIALSNVSQRIKLAFGPMYGIEISSQLAVGTEVEIVLPLIDKLEDLNTAV